MRSLRQNKWWLALVLVLAMVSTLAGGPALAFAGDDSGQPRVAYGAATASTVHCDMPAVSQPCCCEPSDAKAAEHSHGLGRATRDCGCSLELPDAPAPTEARFTRLLPVVDLFCLPAAQPAVAMPLSVPWVFAAPTNGPPRAAFSASTPSRAPPAC